MLYLCLGCSVTQSCLKLFCDPMDCSLPGFPVLHFLPEFPQTHIHWVIDAIQTSHSPSPSFPSDFNLSEHQRLFQWVSCSHQVPKYWSCSISPSKEYSGLISFRIYWSDLLAVQGTQESSPTPQFERISSLVLSLLYSHSAIPQPRNWHFVFNPEPS